eukprot:553532-Hanusia_phi.AAC.2
MHCSTAGVTVPYGGPQLADGLPSPEAADRTLSPPPGARAGPGRGPIMPPRRPGSRSAPGRRADCRLSTGSEPTSDMPCHHAVA